jgi:hypothetical protein
VNRLSNTVSSPRSSDRTRRFLASGLPINHVILMPKDKGPQFGAYLPASLMYFCFGGDTACILPLARDACCAQLRGEEKR